MQPATIVQWEGLVMGCQFIQHELRPRMIQRTNRNMVITTNLFYTYLTYLLISMNFPKDIFLKLVYYLVCPLLLLSYLLEPFTSDVRIYLGAAKVTALTPGFPMNLDSVWESRFVGHRFLYYILNLLDPFTGWMYSIWMKFIVSVVTIVILYYFSKRISERMQVPIHYPFVLGYLGLFAVNNLIIFSAEYHAVVIGMLILTLLLDTRKLSWQISGLLILPLLLMKGLPVLIVLVVILAVVMLVPDYRSRFYSALISLPVVGVVVLAVVLYFPHFISDIFLLTRLGHLNHLSVIQIIESFFYWGIGVIGFAPLIIVSVFVSFLLLSVVTKDHVRDIKVLVAMWLVAAVYTVIISEFFYYHYYLMLIPALLTICYFLKIVSSHWLAFVSIIVLVLVIYAGVVSGWSVGLAFKGYAHWSERESSAADIISRYDVLSQPVTLYLNDGEAAYYMSTKSACRYVGSLPPIWNLSGTDTYWEMRNCSLEYTGKYVVVFPLWVDLNVTTHSELSDKINTEYTKVYSNYWDVYQRKDTI